MKPSGDVSRTDPGLAPERTELAWTRTAISFAALGGAMLKSAAAGGFLVLAVSALIWWIGRLPRDAGSSLGVAWRPLLITGISTGIALAALIMIVSGR